MTPKALIVWGGWPGHDPEACAASVDRLLRDEGFDTTIAQGEAGFDRDDLPAFDLIVPNCTMMEIDKAILSRVIAAIEGGTGLGGFHGGMGDAFRTHTAWQFVCGGQFVAHPGNFIDYRVRITAPDDPVVAGIDDFDVRSEQYFMHVAPNVEVLATTTFDGTHAPWTRGTVMPQVWKTRYGAGRVFYSAFGHSAAELDLHPQREILRRGLLWAARPSLSEEP